MSKLGWVVVLSGVLLVVSVIMLRLDPPQVLITGINVGPGIEKILLDVTQPVSGQDVQITVFADDRDDDALIYTMNLIEGNGKLRHSGPPSSPRFTYSDGLPGEHKFQAFVTDPIGNEATRIFVITIWPR